jgi:hypothetical protein
MPPFGRISRRDLIRALRAAGFSGPHYGRRHQVMIRGDCSVRIPNPHPTAIGRNLLSTILKEAGLSKEEWEAR